MSLIAGQVSGDLFRHPPATGIYSMANSVKKADPKPATKENEQNRFENIRKAAAERRRKAYTDGMLVRRPRTTASYENPIVVTSLHHGFCVRTVP
ncbi:hypothetical protein SAZ10_10525 [Mesorhizobium sp. BAC0120]|uniref:hypothetical protein n=1 Tax=Mesorhizobium sp. BAC0120 TaxID=3090670 RepID=UPI00298CB8FE|nr:hypothetical protein [Mesorhizobium sp. BAC0120]MDW6022192.1 hypothetical protein [Mesorhizobium sp. BAC0120]